MSALDELFKLFIKADSGPIGSYAESSKSKDQGPRSVWENLGDFLMDVLVLPFVVVSKDTDCKEHSRLVWFPGCKRTVLLSAGYMAQHQAGCVHA